ncbi:hypothetical protein INT45_008763 [Circinella minor]|uniref:F-box domain-containing protein n=1 Tax=Circinella minor TaxID=1195481 RepID=A0A8H7VIW8_9FUNG|nr:hypothetical protein INT45_008763 [Circinella minor]
MDKKSTGNDSSILPPMRLTPLAASFLKVAESIDSAIDNCDYDSTINHTTCTIDQQDIQQLLMALIDTRAYSYAMQGQMDLAIADAYKMMSLPSMLPNGYLRKAEILKMDGKLQEAIQVYDDGLRKTPPEEKNKAFIQQLKNGLKEARIQNKEPVDFISKLPVEIVNNNIIPHLEQSTKEVCLQVSRVWHKKLLDYQDKWSNLFVDDDNQETLRVFNTIPSTEYNIKQLTINTESDTIPITCFRYMRYEYLNKIESLKIKITDIRTEQQLLNRATVFIAFWETRQTLTTLDLDFGSNTNLIKLADLIMTCTNLTKSSFTTTQPLAEIIGNFSTMKRHEALIDLQIKAKLITGQDIEPMLQHCQQLRRLVMNTCNETVFDAITRQADNLEILGYNPNAPNDPIEELQTERNNESKKGLQKLYTNNGSISISAKSILPLIYKNKTTLVTLYAMIDTVTETELWDLYSTYPDFTLDNIERLVFWYKPGIQQFMLRAIRNTTTLKIIDIVYLADSEGLVTTLKRLPVLSKITLAQINSIESRPSLCRLIEHYRMFSMPNDFQQPSLEYVDLFKSDAISDDLLSKLATIKTLDKISLCNLKNVSTKGLNSMISKLSDRLTWLRVQEMNLITDNITVSLGDLKKLWYLELEDLKNVTDQGIYGLLAKVDSSILTKLVIDNCPKITASCIATAREKIEEVEQI